MYACMSVPWPYGASVKSSCNDTLKGSLAVLAFTLTEVKKEEVVELERSAIKQTHQQV